jgi:hypothetical protein
MRELPFAVTLKSERGAPLCNQRLENWQQRDNSR